MIKSPTSLYNALSPCSRFSLNGCRDVTGNKTELNCEPMNKPDGWDSYRGLADILDCNTPDCICYKGFFDISFGRLFNISIQYCNYLPALKDRPSPEYEELVSLLANYCAENGDAPSDYFATIEGKNDTAGVLESGDQGESNRNPER